MSTAATHGVPRRSVPRRTATAAPAPRPTRASTGPTSPTPSLSTARRALSEARRLRGEYLVALASGLILPRDVVQAAMADSGKPLRRISLRQMHLSQSGWGERRTSRLLSALAERLGDNDDVKDMTISWLIDPRSGGRRYLAWLDVQQSKTQAPWPGFPFAARKGDR